MPALPLHTAGKYVAAAYIIFLTVLVVYVAIMSVRVGRARREIAELSELVDGGDRAGDPSS